MVRRAELLVHSGQSPPLTFLVSLFLLRAHPPSGSFSKYFRAFGACSNIWGGGNPSTSTMRFIWSAWGYGVGGKGRGVTKATLTL